METKLEQIAAKAVKQRPKSVVREIRTPRSVGTGGGRPPPVTRWAPSNGCPYRNRKLRRVLVYCEPGRPGPGRMASPAATLAVAGAALRLAIPCGISGAEP